MNNLYDFYSEICKTHESAMLFDGQISYGEAFEIAKSRAAFLQKEGYKRGTAIAILAGTSKEWCMTYMAITMAGFIAVPLDTNLPAASYPQLLAEARIKAVFGDRDLLVKISKIKKYDIMFAAKMEKTPFKIQAIDEATPANYLFTSGTTGKPKIVVLTHANIFKTAINDSTFLGLEESDVFLCLLPLFHVYAFLANFFGPFAKGSSLHFLKSLKGPDIIEKLSAHQFTIFPAAPQLWELFMDSILSKAKSASKLKYNLLIFFMNNAPLLNAIGLSFLTKKVFSPIHKLFGPKMKYFISGGAPLKKQYFKWYKNIGLQICEGYGLTETTGPICISHPKKNKRGSVGPAMPGNEISIRNINRDGFGEIWLKGSAVMPGYLNNPKANAEVFDSEGFFNSGDLGRLDRDGWLFVTGRVKNVIVLDTGKNVYPEELESWYKQSPEIEQISVFGRTVNGRETVFSVIVPKDKTPDSYDRIAAEVTRLGKSLPFYKTIASFAISHEPLPVNSSKKILVTEVIKNLDKGLYISSPQRSRNEQPLEGKTAREKQILKALTKHLKLQALYPTQNFYDLGLGSLDTINLIGALEEELSISIDLETFKQLPNLEKSLDYLANLKTVKGLTIERQILESEDIRLPLTFYNPLVECIAFILSFIVRRFYKFEVRGRENYPEDSAILVANHESNLDIMLMYCFVPYSKRKNLYVIGKKELSFLRYLLPGTNVIFVDRQGDVVPSLKASVALLKKGKSIFIFPEGTRNESIGTFKAGAAWLAKNLNKAIIPVAFKGTAAVLPKGKFFFRCGKDLSLTVEMGKAIKPRASLSVEALNDMIKANVEKMLHAGTAGSTKAAAQKTGLQTVSNKSVKAKPASTGKTTVQKKSQAGKTVKKAAKTGTSKAVQKKSAAGKTVKKAAKKSAIKAGPAKGLSRKPLKK